MARYGALPPEQRQANLPCSVEDCAKLRSAKGFCSNHYRRMKIYGDVNATRIREHTGSKVHNTPEYRTYHHMVSRCKTKTDKSFKNYGGRGIKVCDRWLEANGKGFNNFLADMGNRPSLEYSIDRINNDGNYEPSNCKWSSRIQQMNNTRRNFKVEAYGKIMTGSQWERELGLKPGTVAMRHYIGRTGTELLTPNRNCA